MLNACYWIRQVRVMNQGWNSKHIQCHCRIMQAFIMHRFCKCIEFHMVRIRLLLEFFILQIIMANVEGWFWKRLLLHCCGRGFFSREKKSFHATKIRNSKHILQTGRMNEGIVLL